MPLIALSNFVGDREHGFDRDGGGVVWSPTLSFKSGGFIAGTILEGSAVMAFFIHVGVGELHHMWWLPLGLGCQLKARKTQEWKWFFAVATWLEPCSPAFIWASFWPCPFGFGRF